MSATRCLDSALPVSAGAGRARSRTNGSPVSQPWSRQYPHADRSEANRTLNVVAAPPPHTKMNQPATRSGSSSATLPSAPKSRTNRSNTTA